VSKRRHTRKRRRQQNMVLRTGGKFEIRHRNKGGRTGTIHSKKPKPKGEDE